MLTWRESKRAPASRSKKCDADLSWSPNGRGPHPCPVGRTGMSGELDPYSAVCPCDSSSVNPHGCLGITHPGDHLERLRGFWYCRSSNLCRRERDRLSASNRVVQGRIDILESITLILAHESNIVSNLSGCKRRMWRASAEGAAGAFVQ